MAELRQLKALKVNPKQIHLLSDAMLQSWIDKMRKELKGDDKPLKWRMIQQFVAKVILKQETATLYYTFPLPDDAYMSSYRDVDLRDGNPITRHVLDFEIALPQSTVTKLSFSNKALPRMLVLEMHEQKMSYREIGKALGLHWTRVHQIVKQAKSDQS